jgi:hypothetical protein
MNKNNVKEEPNAQKPAGGDDGGNNFRRGRRARNRFNNAAGGATGPNAGKATPDAKLLFDNTGPHDAANFQRTLKTIGNYLHTTYGADVANAIRTMTPVTITLPDAPKPTTVGNVTTQPTAAEVHIWKEE